MLLSAGARKTALVIHVVTSVGWLGAVAGFLGLAVVALRTGDAATARALYVSMDVLGTAVLVPLSVASFASGLVQSLDTHWGLFRHWWVIAKLAVSVIATAILLLYTTTLDALGDAAASATLADDAMILPSGSPVLHATGGLVVLLVAVGLSVFKPRGLTRYGWRKQQQRRAQQPTARTEVRA